MIIDPVKLSQKLIACRSVTPEDDGAMDIVQAALTALGFECTRLPFGSGGEQVQNLYAKRGVGRRNLCFGGHTDVVPAGDERAWRHPPFAGEVDNDVLYGRGAVDMKGGVAAFISAVSRVVDSGFDEEEFSLSFLITGDEEASGKNGTIKLIKWLQDTGEHIEACIVGEPTNPHALGDMIKIGRRGSRNFDLTVLGLQGHVAYPDDAQNPIPKMVEILQLLCSAKLDSGNEFFPPSNLEVTSIDVGNATTNVIPARANAKFNVRFNNYYSGDDLVKWVRGKCDMVTSQYTLSYDNGSEPFITKPGALSDMLSDAVNSVTGRTPELGTTGGTSDARFIKDICPVVEFGLMSDTAHQIDECANVEDIKALSLIYEQFIRNFLSRSG